ncbi:hypothetical protein B0T18DRAFT_415395 [Schizothecium vesticola]|uniref:Uncharacterized protein n=1 Tax=Schizothecium vesticola TaxID=314040 RepID=A0AA40EQ96_9PEZI|nr:hypothetical protein B0T18DRAFT_415395 [Schizothecium vesticola]
MPLPNPLKRRGKSREKSANTATSGFAQFFLGAKKKIQPKLHTNLQPQNRRTDSSSSSSESRSQTTRTYGWPGIDTNLLYPTKYIQNRRGRKKRRRASSASSQASQASQVSDASLEPAAATLEAFEDSLDAYKTAIKKSNKIAGRFMKAVRNQKKAPGNPAEYPGRVSPQFKSALEAMERLSWKADECRPIFDTDKYREAEYIISTAPIVVLHDDLTVLINKYPARIFSASHGMLVSSATESAALQKALTKLSNGLDEWMAGIRDSDKGSNEQDGNVAVTLQVPTTARSKRQTLATLFQRASM